MEDVKFLILDEYSMLGLKMLALVDARCKEGKGSDKPFGGLYVYFLGDIRQLPPVKDNPFFAPVKNHYDDLILKGKSILQTFEKCIFLTTCHRQTDKTFERILDRLSTAESTVEGYTFLSSRFTTYVTSSEQEEFRDAMHLFSKKNEVKTYNFEILSSLSEKNSDNPFPIANIEAKHNCLAAKQASPDEAGGLEKVLYLPVGGRIMLKANLWVSKGLVNGAIGEVVDILYNPNEQPPDCMPQVIMCKFNSYKGPGLGHDHNIVPIPAILKTWARDGEQCIRFMFPLVLSYACSIHKAQGLTLDRAFVDIGEHEFALGLSYVALSRVRNIEGLLINPFSFDKLLKLKKLKSMEQRKNFEERLKKLGEKEIN